MTSSIVGTYPDAAPLEDARPRRPVLRPLTEVLPSPGAPGLGRTSVSGRRTGRRGRASSSGAASGYVPTMLLVIEPSCGAGVHEHAGRCVRSTPARRRWGR